MKKQLAGLLITLALLMFAIPVYAGVPLDSVKKCVNEVIALLSDPTLKAESAKEIKKEKLRVLYKQMFDEIEFSKRTLTRNWNKFSPAQRKEFVDLFEQVLEKSYADKVLSYTNEKVEFYKETMLSTNQAEVQSKIITSSKEIPVFYRVILKEGKWKVYDVVVENVSLVQNYRTQFNDILAKDNPEKLLEVLRNKVSKH
ncbi:MAG: ABC transporter substrate-binding protein [Syntrophaceae bacterium]|nr:ABC transporter substrate-binding protein [Syntrophaceae bacterium]